jgi:tRNA nucleotidyltransferase/poly(A) polymerase
MDDLRRRLRELPCGRRLLDAAAGLDGVHLVGGAVRDLLLDRTPRELDVVVDGDVGALAARLGADAVAGAPHRVGPAPRRAGDSASVVPAPQAV